MRPFYVLALAFVFAGPNAVLAQLVDPGASDHYVSGFGLYTRSTGFAGSVASKGEQDLHVPGWFKRHQADNAVTVTWQFDYGSLGTKQVTPTGTVPGKEADISKNSGEYVVSYAHLFPTQVRLGVDVGAEHKRSLDTTTLTTSSVWTPVAMVSGRELGSRTLFGQKADPDSGDELAWVLQADVGAASLLSKTGVQSTELFIDPAAVGWFSLIHGRFSQKGSPDRLFFHVQIRVEAALMHATTVANATGSHWDTSLTYFLTPSNGFELRRFAGYFDHNLHDRKDAWTFALVWKFK